MAGRSELAGNHTDHNCGKVIAASINLDIIAVVAKNNTNLINLKSEGFRQLAIDFVEYNEPNAEHFGTSASLIAGMCRGFIDNNQLAVGIVIGCIIGVIITVIVVAVVVNVSLKKRY